MSQIKDPVADQTIHKLPLDVVSWRGTFSYHHDIQSGRFLGCDNLVLTVSVMLGIGVAEIPVDWHRLRQYDLKLYERIREEAESQLKQQRTSEPGYRY